MTERRQIHIPDDRPPTGEQALLAAFGELTEAEQTAYAERTAIDAVSRDVDAGIRSLKSLTVDPLAAASPKETTQFGPRPATIAAILAAAQKETERREARQVPAWEWFKRLWAPGERWMWSGFATAGACAVMAFMLIQSPDVSVTDATTNTGFGAYELESEINLGNIGIASMSEDLEWLELEMETPLWDEEIEIS